MTARRSPAFRSIKKIAKRLLYKLDAFLLRLREPSITGREYVQGLDALSGIYPSTIIVVQSDKSGTGHVRLGPGLYLGRRVELEAGKIDIGEGTTIQDGGAVRGHVRIGSHCMIGHNSLILSSTHNFRLHPEWLICDQDEEIQRTGDPTHVPTHVWIDDDCWLGWSCCVMPGVHVGRGAILSANCLVTNDVGPYEIHAGIPNRKIGDRLIFSPPSTIHALNDLDLPYFYSGFHHPRSRLAESRKSGTIYGKARAAIVLCASDQAEINLEGVRYDGDGELCLRFWWNGIDIGTHDIQFGNFSLRLRCPDTPAPIAGFVPPGLAAHTYLEWRDETADLQLPDHAQDRRYGIARAEIT